MHFWYLLNQLRKAQQITHGVQFIIRDQASYVLSLSNFKFLLTGKVDNVYVLYSFRGKKGNEKREKRSITLNPLTSHLISRNLHE